jgi:hypothetical protein
VKIIYIAGPFRAPAAWGIEQNIREAERVGLEVARVGAVPLIPHTMYRHFQGACSDDFWLQATSDLLRKSDAVLLLPRWRLSAGARGEERLARTLGLPVFHSLAALSTGLPGPPEDYQPVMTCRCGAEYADFDGMDVVFCFRCGFCRHFSRTDGVCDACGTVRPCQSVRADQGEDQPREPGEG